MNQQIQLINDLQFFLSTLAFVAISVLFIFGANYCKNTNKKHLAYACYLISLVSAMPFLFYIVKLFINTFNKVLLLF